MSFFIRRILESQSQWKVTSEANSYKLHLRKSLCVFCFPPPASCRGRKVDFSGLDIFFFVCNLSLSFGGRTWGNDLEYDFSTYIRFAPGSCLQRPILNLNLFGQRNTRYKRITYYNGPHDLHAYQNNTPAISCCERSMFS